MCVAIFVCHKIGGTTDTQWACTRHPNSPQCTGQPQTKKNFSTKKCQQCPLDNSRECQDKDGKSAPSRVVTAKPGYTPKDLLNENSGRREGPGVQILQHFAGGSDMQLACLLSRHELEHSRGPFFVFQLKKRKEKKKRPVFVVRTSQSEYTMRITGHHDKWCHLESTFRSITNIFF